jgi:hypothetical protein
LTEKREKALYLLLERLPGVGRIVQWESICLAYARPWVPTPAQKKKKGKGKEWKGWEEREGEGERGGKHLQEEPYCPLLVSHLLEYNGQTKLKRGWETWSFSRVQ